MYKPKHSLSVSPKYGLNPTINVCAFCGKDKELLLLGRLKGDVKAPPRIIANYTPCEECKQKMTKGRTVVEVVTYDTGALPIKEGAWPTGRWMVISRESAAKMFNDDSDKPILLSVDVYSKLITKR